MSSTLSGVISAAAFVVGVILLIKILTAPLRKAVKFLLHAALGFALLLLLNFLGLSIEITLFRVAIAGIFGVPGVLAVVLFSLL